MLPLPTDADVVAGAADASDVNAKAEEAATPVKNGDFASLTDAQPSVQRCVAHRRADTEGVKGEEWCIQRYDVPEGEWRRGIMFVGIHTPVAEWEWGSTEKTERGLVLSIVIFDPTGDGRELGQVVVVSGSTEEEVWELIHQMRSELWWEWSYVQFLD